MENEGTLLKNSVTPYPGYITIGHFGRPHGVNGWLYVVSHTIPADAIIHYQPWWVHTANQWQLCTPSTTRTPNAKSNRFLVKIEHCTQREHAACYTNQAIQITRDTLPAPAADEYYLADLYGATVMNTQGIVLGIVEELLETKAHPIISIKGSQHYLIPCLATFILSMDPEQRLVVVNWACDSSDAD